MASRIGCRRRSTRCSSRGWTRCRRRRVEPCSWPRSWAWSSRRRIVVALSEADSRRDRCRPSRPPAGGARRCRPPRAHARLPPSAHPRGRVPQPAPQHAAGAARPHRWLDRGAWRGGAGRRARAALSRQRRPGEGRAVPAPGRRAGIGPERQPRGVRLVHRCGRGLRRRSVQPRRDDRGGGPAALPARRDRARRRSCRRRRSRSSSRSAPSGRPSMRAAGSAASAGCSATSRSRSARSISRSTVSSASDRAPSWRWRTASARRASCSSPTSRPARNGRARPSRSPSRPMPRPRSCTPTTTSGRA